MLHRIRFTDALQRASKKIFLDKSNEIQTAINLWKMLITDKKWLQTCIKNNTTVPTWNITDVSIHEVHPLQKPYRVVGIDGSQIYPDKHQGVNCFLINIGAVILSYKTIDHGVSFDSYPFLFADAINEDQTVSLIDVINAKREAFELEYGYKKMLEYQQRGHTESMICMMDGTFIFRHLPKEKSFHDHFFKIYCTHLDAYRKKNMLLLGYLSYPRNKELIQLIAMYAKEHNIDFTADAIVDTMVFEHLLQPGQRTSIFYHRSSITQAYPEHLVPCFVYFNVGSEIVRIEFPCYEATQEQVDLLCAAAYDQAQKGIGYPVCLAEAHEQAVVTNDDRAFFYHMIEQLSIKEKKQIILSPKLQKKKILAV